MIGKIVAETIEEMTEGTIEETTVGTTAGMTAGTIDETIAGMTKGTIVEAIKEAVVGMVDDTIARTTREGTIVITLLERAKAATGKIGVHFGAKDEAEGTIGVSSALVRSKTAVIAAKAIAGAATETRTNKVMIVETTTVDAINRENRGKAIPSIQKTIMLRAWKSRKATTMTLWPGASSKRTARRRRPKEKTRTRLCNGASRGRA